MQGRCQYGLEPELARTASEGAAGTRRREHIHSRTHETRGVSAMSTKIIVSYDGTANENDAIAFGSLLVRAGAEVSLGYVRHTDQAVSDEEAQEVLDRG